MIEATVQRLMNNMVKLPQTGGERRRCIVDGKYNSQSIYCQFIPSIRNCSQSRVDSQELDKMVDNSVSAYLKRYNESEDRFCNLWKVMEYKEGHFIEHIDKQEETETHYQVATQILLPPRQLCNYEGGILKIRTKENEIIEVTPCNEKWTHAIIPIGLLHEVTQVKGTRISYVRRIYVKKEEGKNYPKQSEIPGIEKLTVVVN